jgi:hypothetical protein
MSENPQTQVADAFGVHLHWPDEGTPRPLSASATHIGCPLCGMLGVKYLAPVCVGEPQPSEEQPCLLCEGETWVSMAEYILYKTEGLDAVLDARARVRRLAATVEPF